MIVPKSEAKQGYQWYTSQMMRLCTPKYTTLASTPRVLQEYIGIEAFLVLVLVLAREQEPKTIYASKERANILFRPQHVFSVSKTICLPGGDFSLCC